jgi:hypothetical protein
MREAGTGLFPRRGKSARKSHEINRIRAELVFCGTEDECAHNSKKISALRAELVFREVPGQLGQRRRQAQRFRHLGLGLAPVQPPGDGIVRILPPPTGLGLPPPRRLTFRPMAGSLAGAYAWIRTEPPAANRAGSLAGLGHRE